MTEQGGATLNIIHLVDDWPISLDSNGQLLMLFKWISNWSWNTIG